MGRKLLLLISICFCFFVFGCKNNSLETSTVAERPKETKNWKIDILGYFENKKKEENLVISTAGIESLMRFVSEAADGETKEEIDKVFNTKNRNLNSEAVNTYNFMVFNRSNGCYKLRPTFIDDFNKKSNIKASIYQFSNNSELPNMVDKINKDISDATNGQLSNVIEKKTYEKKEFLSEFANVIHFLGSWADAEDEGFETRNYYFGSNKKPSEFIDIPENNAKLYENDNVYASVLEYKEDNKRYKFVAILPKIENTPITSLDLNNLKEPVGTYILKISLPTFSFENNLPLYDFINGLNINKLFENADLSKAFEKIIPEALMYASEIKQIAKIKLDRKGTEASAYTSLIMEKCMTSMIEFSFIDVRKVILNYNRPFYYVIYDSVEQIPIFLGKIHKVDQIDKVDIDTKMEQETSFSEQVKLNRTKAQKVNTIYDKIEKVESTTPTIKGSGKTIDFFR